MNWYVGWSMILAAFVSGAGLGLAFHRDDFLGGYGSFRRRVLRLGHIALAALGVINVLFSVSVPVATHSIRGPIAGIALVVGGLSMPAVCFLTAWRVGCRRLFFVPVVALIVAVIQVLRIGP
jgi:hypothetical protein